MKSVKSFDPHKIMRQENFSYNIALTSFIVWLTGYFSLSSSCETLQVQMITYIIISFLMMVTPGPGVLSLAGVGAGFGWKVGMMYLIGLFWN